MSMKAVLTCGLALAMVAIAHAQAGQTQGTASPMKLVATMACPKLEPGAPVEVGDQPGHTLSINKGKCMYSKGEIAGAQMKEQEDTFTSDTSGSTARDRGYSVINLANGDKAFVQWQGTTMIKNNAPVSGMGTWTFMGGTGKSKSLKGKGTYNGTFKADGSSSWEIMGDYTAGPPAGK